MAQSVIEAFNLRSLDRNVIDSHLIKLFGYDPSGLEHNYIIVYSEAEDLLGLWQKYLKHLPKVDFKYKLKGSAQEEETKFTDIKVARACHMREGKEIYVYHLFVNMAHSS